MSKSSYRQVYDEEWLPLSKTEIVACCDCGLTHIIRYRVKNGKPEVQYTRDNRRTSQIRRWAKRKGKKNESTR